MDKLLAKAGIDIKNEEREVYTNCADSFLIQETLRRGQGKLSRFGALCVKTGKFTGRAAKDKYVVKTASTNESIWWENNINAMTPENFDKLKKKTIDYLNEDIDLFISDRSVGAHKDHTINCCLVSTHPHHVLFSTHLFRKTIRSWNDEDFTILHVPAMKIDPAEYGAKSETIIATCFDSKVTIITGTFYAGEIKKSMFSVMNYILPTRGVLPMHAGCSQAASKESSIFFGLSGTGKTTLSTDQGTLLIGDDEHGLSDDGVFNFEGGCYAKTFKLSEETEPEIYRASTRFGALLENVVVVPETGLVDFFDKSLSENGRSSYPLKFIETIKKSSKGKVPKHIFFLTADAFGILPPIAQLTIEQAMFYFVLGYTAKVAGTEVGVKEPEATFSPCFGAPFMLRHPSVYAELLGGYLKKYNINIWLVNTGWTGGPYGVGNRFPLHVTRKIIRTAQANKLKNARFDIDPIFGLAVPKEVVDVPSSLLIPKRSWSDSDHYDQKAKELAQSFHTQMKNFDTFYQKNINGAPTYGE